MSNGRGDEVRPAPELRVQPGKRLPRMRGPRGTIQDYPAESFDFIPPMTDDDGSCALDVTEQTPTKSIEGWVLFVQNLHPVCFPSQKYPQFLRYFSGSDRG